MTTLLQLSVIYKEIENSSVLFENRKFKTSWVTCINHNNDTIILLRLPCKPNAIWKDGTQYTYLIRRFDV